MPAEAEDQKPIKVGDKVKITGLILIDGQSNATGTVEGVITKEYVPPPEAGPKEK